VQALEKAHSEGSLLHALTLTLYVGYIAIVAVVQLVKLLIFLTSCAYASVCARFSGGRNVAAAVGGGFDGLSAATDGGGGGGATAADGDSSTQPRAPHITITMRDFVAAGADSAALEALAAGGGGGSGSSGIEHYGCAGDVASSPARGRGSERAPVVTRLRGDSHGCTATAVDAVCGSPAAKRLQRRHPGRCCRTAWRRRAVPSRAPQAASARRLCCRAHWLLARRCSGVAAAARRRLRSCQTSR